MPVKEMPSDFPALRCWGELRPLCVSWSFWKRAKHSSSLGSLLPAAHQQNTYCVARLDTHLQNIHHVPCQSPCYSGTWILFPGACGLMVFHTLPVCAWCISGFFLLAWQCNYQCSLFLVVSLRSLPLPCSVHLQVPLLTSAQFSRCRMTKQ